MHVSLRHARRVILGTAVAALFLAGMPSTGQAQTDEGLISICVNPSGGEIKLPLSKLCKKPNILLTWDPNGLEGPAGPIGIAGLQGPAGPTGPTGANGAQGGPGAGGAIGVAGPTGASGPSGPQGLAGPAGPIGSTGTPGASGPAGPGGLAGIAGAIGVIGPTGASGQAGPSGPVGPGGADGLVGNLGPTGPGGEGGGMGAQGPQGQQGAQGLTGSNGLPGLAGLNGTNGTQSFLLTGGDLGFKVQFYNYINFTGPNGPNEFLLGGASSTPIPGWSPLYYGPGNGVDQVLNSEAVPVDAGVASHLYVETASTASGANPEPFPSTYKFELCINSNCHTGVTCTITLPTLTECQDLVDTQAYNAGDDIALKGIASSGCGIDCAQATNVKWSVVYALTTPPPPTPTATPTPPAP